MSIERPSVIYRVEHRSRKGEREPFRKGLYSYRWTGSRSKKPEIHWCEGPTTDPVLQHVFVRPVDHPELSETNDYYFGFPSIVHMRMWINDEDMYELNRCDCVVRAYYGHVVHGRRQSVINVSKDVVEIVADRVDTFSVPHSHVLRLARGACSLAGVHCQL